jgi:hypothetical protein
MNIIPANLLPKTLKSKILLPNLSKIEILHKNKSNMFINTLVFVKRYGPSIKFYNESLTFQRKIAPERASPLIAVYGQENKKLGEFEPGLLNPEEILQKIEQFSQEKKQ